MQLGVNTYNLLCNRVHRQGFTNLKSGILGECVITTCQSPYNQLIIKKTRKT